MPISYVESLPAIVYHGITIYHIYKDDLIEQPPMEHWFTLNPYGFYGSDDAFDVREQMDYDNNKSIAANLVQMIDAGIFGETNVAEREGTHADDTYAPEDTTVGVCPVCFTEISEYGSFEVHDAQVEYPFTCDNCGVSGSEWGEVVFDGFTIP